MALCIRSLRERAGLSTYDMADKMDVSQAAYYAWERGRAYPSADKLPKLAGIFGVSIDELYGSKTTIPERGG